jgi:hypothetical protein
VRTTIGAPAVPVQVPAAHVSPAGPQAVPSGAKPEGAQTVDPIVHAIAQVRQALPFSAAHGAPGVHAGTHAPPEQDRPSPQGVPSGWGELGWHAGVPP